jgi:hypothetical protein
MYRRCRASKVIDLIYLKVDGKGDVMAYQFEVGVAKQMVDILLASREEIVQAKDFISFFQKALTQVGSQEAATSCYEN